LVRLPTQQQQARQQLTHHLALARPSSNTQARVLSLLELLALAKCFFSVGVVAAVLALVVVEVALADIITIHRFLFHRELWQ
jgi:hypothetical protein